MCQGPNLCHECRSGVQIGSFLSMVIHDVLILMFSLFFWKSLTTLLLFPFCSHLAGGLECFTISNLGWAKYFPWFQVCLALISIVELLPSYRFHAGSESQVACFIMRPPVQYLGAIGAADRRIYSDCSASLFFDLLSLFLVFPVASPPEFYLIYFFTLNPKNFGWPLKQTASS